VRSVLTYLVMRKVGTKVKALRLLRRRISGQLPDLGLCVPRPKVEYLEQPSTRICLEQRHEVPLGPTPLEISLARFACEVVEPSAGANLHQRECARRNELRGAGINF
jgi:hypothetical protein